ncbi:hypothetical protein INS49_006317 [Diaporthe citri]|uniref:uncharacterized protein n=1 Tax=Diaporthe citri TaxID=83186 RepID=UPI001C8180BC|nr:uncharacterized protein INS49_006317 [Diaporthe citri]KAG6364713.1 hypothetical protein INS49_006317 [Diaporthe citri]
MATLKATDPTLKSDDPTTEGTNSEDPKPEDPESENPPAEEMKPEDPKPESPQTEEIKPEEEEGQGLHAATMPKIPSLPTAVASDRWQTNLETLLRFPGMIALALGVTDSAYTIIESSWVKIAERVFEIQTCCLMHAKHITFDIAADGWVTWDITAEWYDRVLQDLQGKGFRTTCTAMIAFVARFYLQSSSWIRFSRSRGRQRHKRIMNGLKPDPSAALITRCSSLAKGFTNIVMQSRRRAIKRAEKQHP